jgi:hypothetical protein
MLGVNTFQCWVRDVTLDITDEIRSQAERSSCSTPHDLRGVWLYFSNTEILLSLKLMQQALGSRGYPLSWMRMHANSCFRNRRECRRKVDEARIPERPRAMAGDGQAIVGRSA